MTCTGSIHCIGLEVKIGGPATPVSTQTWGKYMANPRNKVYALNHLN